MIWKLIDKFRVFLLGHHYPCKRLGCMEKRCPELRRVFSGKEGKV